MCAGCALLFFFLQCMNLSFHFRLPPIFLPLDDADSCNVRRVYYGKSTLLDSVMVERQTCDQDNVRLTPSRPTVHDSKTATFMPSLPCLCGLAV